MRGPNFSRLKVFCVMLPLLTTVSIADDDFHLLRGSTAIDKVAPAPPLATDEKKMNGVCVIIRNNHQRFHIPLSATKSAGAIYGDIRGSFGFAENCP